MKLNRGMLSLSLLLALLAPWSAAAANLDFQSKNLSNGMQVVYKVIPSKTATARVVVPVGMLNEPRGLRGISHLLEHLIYRGPENSPAGEFLALLEEENGEFNGMTTLERTEYYMSVPSESFPKTLRLCLEMLFHPDLARQDIDLEKKIINVENVLRTDPGNTFFLYLNELTERQLDAAVNSITREDLIHYHRQFYNPKRMTLIVTGNFEPEELFKLVQGFKAGADEDTFQTVSRLFRDLPNNVVLEDYLAGETYQILFGFELNDLSKKNLFVAKALPLIFDYESYQYDYLTNRPLDYQIRLFNLTDRFYLVFMYRDCQNLYTLEINNWHLKNLERFCKYLQTKKFDKFLDWLAGQLDRRFQIMGANPVYLNVLYRDIIFEPSALTIKDLAAIRSLNSNDIKNFVQKYLQGKSYHKVVIKAL